MWFIVYFGVYIHNIKLIEQSHLGHYHCDQLIAVRIIQVSATSFDKAKRR